MTIIVAGGAAGTILGLLAATIWRSISGRLAPVDFWPSFRRLTQALLCAADEREFRVQYCQLLKVLASYLVRNLLLTAASAAPVLLFVLFVVPAAKAEGHREAAEAGVVRSSCGRADADWPWGTGPEAAFSVGLSLSSWAGIVLRRTRLP